MHYVLGVDNNSFCRRNNKEKGFGIHSPDAKMIFFNTETFYSSLAVDCRELFLKSALHVAVVTIEHQAPVNS